MPHPMAVGEIYEGRIYCKLKNQLAINTTHWRVSAVAGIVNDDELAKQLDLAVTTPLTLLLCSEAQYQGVTVQKVFPLPRTVATLNSFSAGFGAPARPTLPGNLCGLIQKRTNLAGPKFRGRVYVPFPSEEDNTDVEGVPSALYKINMGTYAAAIFGTFMLAPAGGGTATLTPVVLHRADMSTTDVDTTHVSNFWADQRRRSDRGKMNVSLFD